MPSKIDKVQCDARFVPPFDDVEAVGTVPKQAVELESNDGPRLPSSNSIEHLGSAVPRCKGFASRHPRVDHHVNEVEIAHRAVGSDLLLLGLQADTLDGLLLCRDAYVRDGAVGWGGQVWGSSLHLSTTVRFLRRSVKSPQRVPAVTGSSIPWLNK